MAVSQIYSASIIGLSATPIEIEADISSGLPAFNIVGLPDKAVEEAKERVRAALKNSGAPLPSRRITVNLAPAHLKKEGALFDLAIATAILVAGGFIPKLSKQELLVGELALNGDLRPIAGILPIALLCQKQGFKKIYLPELNANEAALVPGLEIYPLQSLGELIAHYKKEKTISPYRKNFSLKDFLKTDSKDQKDEFDFALIKGQEQAKRALEIAAAGMHNVLMSGPPGAGKTLLARATATIMPTMTREEIFNVSQIYSVAGLLSHQRPLQIERPFRSPHHTASDVALVGGGQRPRPGEITLAHHGVLFLDELPEFNKNVLESLRQPLEDRTITVSRAAFSETYPAHFLLIAAMNPCPCGYLNDPQKQCVCSPAQIIRYQKKISGPLLDRIDIYLEVSRLKYEKLAAEEAGESSKEIRKRVEKARAIQHQRFQKEKIGLNSEMKLFHLKRYCPLDGASEALLKNAVNQLGLSARAYYKVIKIARTIADLENSEQILSSHIAEAIQYRPREIRY